MELLLEASKKCLEQSSYESKDIELLIYCGVYRSEYLLEPAYAALLAGKLDMNATLTDSNKNKTFAFDIFNGSTGFFNACFLAQQMIKAGNYKTVMVVASEIENNAKLFPDKLIGICETASAIILDAHPNEKKGLSNIQFNYDLESLDDYTTNCAVVDTNVCMFVKKNPDLEEKYIASILPSVKKLLQKEGLELDQIDVVFPSQISSGFVSQLSEQLEIPLEKFVDVVGEGPDIFSSSLPFGFSDAYKKELANPGSIGLIINVGSGIQVASAIYYF